MHVELSDGHSAEMRDTESLRFKDRDAFLEHVPVPDGGVSAGVPTAQQAKYGVAVKNYVIAWAITSWTLPLPLPSEDVSSLGELSITDGLKLEAIGQQLQSVLMPDFSPNPDDASPTPPSNA